MHLHGNVGFHDMKGILQKMESFMSLIHFKIIGKSKVLIGTENGLLS